MASPVSSKRVGAVVVVQQRSLRPLQQDRLALLEGLAQQRPGVGHHGPQQLPEREEVIGELASVVGLLAVDVLEDGVLLAQSRLELGAENVLVEDVLHPDARARDLVLVGGADAAVGGSDLRLPEGLLAVGVEPDVVRQDQVRPTVDLEPLAHAQAPLLERRDLSDEDLRVDDDPVADGAHDPLPHDAGRDEVHDELLFADPDRVPRVVAAGVARDVAHVRRQRVANPSLALVPPGQPEDYRGRHSLTSAMIEIKSRLSWNPSPSILRAGPRSIATAAM
jgi:hypothetical protein